MDASSVFAPRQNRFADIPIGLSSSSESSLHQSSREPGNVQGSLKNSAERSGSLCTVFFFLENRVLRRVQIRIREVDGTKRTYNFAGSGAAAPVDSRVVRQTV